MAVLGPSEASWTEPIWPTQQLSMSDMSGSAKLHGTSLREQGRSRGKGGLIE